MAWKDLFAGMLGNAFVKIVGDPHGNVVVVRDVGELAKELRPRVHDGVSSILLDAVETHGRVHGDLVEDMAYLACAMTIAGTNLVDQGFPPSIVARGFDIARATMWSAIDSLPRSPVPREEKALVGRLRDRMAVGLHPAVAGHLAALVAGPLARCQPGGTPGLAGLATCSPIALAAEFFKTFSIELVPGGRVLDSVAVSGVALRHEPLTWRARDRGAQELSLKDARIAIVDGDMYFERRKHEQLEFVLDTPGAVAGMTGFWEVRWEAMAVKLSSLRIDMLATERGIDDTFVSTFHALRPAGLIFRRVTRERLERLARATGAAIVPSIDMLGPGDVGRVRSTRVVSSRGDDVFLFDCGPVSGHATLVIRGGSNDVCEGVEGVVRRAVHAEIASWNGALPGYPGALLGVLPRAAGTARERATGKVLLAVDTCLEVIADLVAAHAANAGLDPVDGVPGLQARDVSLHAVVACVGSAMEIASRLARVDAQVQVQGRKTGHDAPATGDDA